MKNRRFPTSGLSGGFFVSGSGGDACGEQLVDIELVGAYGREDNANAPTHRFEVGAVFCIGDHQGVSAGSPIRSAHFDELVSAAPGHGPAWAVVARTAMLREILGDEPPGIAGGTIDDDVKFGVGHALSPFAPQCARGASVKGAFERTFAVNGGSRLTHVIHSPEQENRSTQYASCKPALRHEKG